MRLAKSLLIFLCLWFFGLTKPILGQSAMEEKQATDSIEYYLDESLNAVKDEKYSEALILALKAKNLAISFQRIDLAADSYNNLGFIEYNRRSFSTATEYYRTALIMRQEMGDSLQIGNSYRNLMNLSRVLGRNQEAITYGDSALFIFSAINSPMEIASIYNSQGIMYNEGSRFQKSIDSYNKAISIWRSLGDSLRLSFAYNNIANSYFDFNDYVRAEEFALKSAELKSKVGTKYSLAITSKNLGRIYTKLGALTKAKAYFEQSDSLRKEVIYINKNANSILQTADSLKYLGDYTSAINFYEDVVPLMKELNPLDILSLYSKLLEAYRLNGETPPESLVGNERSLRDSLNLLIMVGLDPPESSIPQEAQATSNLDFEIIITILLVSLTLVIIRYRITLRKKKESEAISKTMENKAYNYQIGLSYSRRNSNYVKRVAGYLKKNGVTYFFDNDEQSNLWGKNLYQHLSEVYSKKCLYCVIFLSEHYAKSRWTKLELESAQERAFRENREYILPVRFDDTVIPGLKSTTAYMDGNKVSPEDLGKLLLEKLSGGHHKE